MPNHSTRKRAVTGDRRRTECTRRQIIEWTGFAIATWALPGVAFALYTAANVGPRALANHRWYRERFENYPAERKALIPFVL